MSFILRCRKWDPSLLPSVAGVRVSVLNPAGKMRRGWLRETGHMLSGKCPGLGPRWMWI